VANGQLLLVNLVFIMNVCELLNFNQDKHNLYFTDRYTGDNNTLSLELGAGMFLNHQNPSTVYHTFSEHTSQSVNQNLAHTTYVTAPMIANRDILPGEEISISYGETNEWLENRGIIIKEVTNASTSVRSMEDLKENGHCITQVKVKLNSVVFNL
jgi:SET domain-containing protein